jgi:hypothetical protein
VHWEHEDAPRCVGSRRSSPPWFSVMLREMLRPSPVPAPGSLVVKNGSMIFSASSGGTPGPVSSTVMRARAPSPVIDTETSAPSRPTVAS